MSFYDILSALGALLIIVLMLFLTYYGSRWYARRMGGGAVLGKHIKVLDRAQLGGNAYIAIVQVGGHFYLMGISEKRMELICELTDFDPPPQAGPQVKALPFGQIFADLLEKAKGKKDKEGEE